MKFEVASELQKLWDSCYWEKKEEVYPHLKKSKFTLEPGDTVESLNRAIEDSDMIMTHGDLNTIHVDVSKYLALARVTGSCFENRGYGSSTCQYLVRGKSMNISLPCYGREKNKQAATMTLEDYRKGGRRYEEMVEDEMMNRVKIESVRKDGWMMSCDQSGSSMLDCDQSVSVFVPLPAKVAKMGVKGTDFPGMRLAMAGGVWRPLPYGGRVCNIYPPTLYEDWD